MARARVPSEAASAPVAPAAPRPALNLQQDIANIIAAGGGTIALPMGDFDIGAVRVPFVEQLRPHLPPPQVRIVGEGAGTVLRGSITVERAFATLSDLTVRGHVALIAPGDHVLRNIGLDRVNVIESQDSLLVVHGTVILSRFTDCMFGGATGNQHAFVTGPATTTLRFERCSFKAFERGMMLQGAGHSLVDCHFEDNRGLGPYLSLHNALGTSIRGGWWEEAAPRADGDSPWFIYSGTGCDAVTVDGVRFVRKNPKARVYVHDDAARPILFTMSGASVRVVGSWDRQPLVWVRGRGSVVQAQAMVEDDSENRYTTTSRVNWL